MNKEIILNFYKRQLFGLYTLIFASISFILAPIYLIIYVWRDPSFLIIILPLILLFGSTTFFLIKILKIRKNILLKIQSGEINTNGELNCLSFRIGRDNVRIRMLKDVPFYQRLSLLIYLNDEIIDRKKIGGGKSLHLHEKHSEFLLANAKRVLVDVDWTERNFFKRHGNYDQLRAIVNYGGRKKGEIKFWDFPEKMPK